MEEKKRFIPALVSTIKYNRKVKVADIKQYLVDEYKLTNKLNKENKDLRKELEKAKEVGQKYDLALVTLDEYKNRIKDKDTDIKELKNSINELKNEINDYKSKINDMVIKERQMQKDIDIRAKEAEKKLETVKSEVKKAVNDYKIELYNLFDSITGTLPKYKIKYVIRTGDILHIDERAKKE